MWFYIVFILSKGSRLDLPWRLHVRNHTVWLDLESVSQRDAHQFFIVSLHFQEKYRRLPKTDFLNRVLGKAVVAIANHDYHDYLPEYRPTGTDGLSLGNGKIKSCPLWGVIWLHFRLLHRVLFVPLCLYSLSHTWMHKLIHFLNLYTAGKHLVWKLC